MKLNWAKSLALLLLSVLTTPLLAHGTHGLEGGVHSLLHVEHVIMLIVLAVIVAAVQRKKK